MSASAPFVRSRLSVMMFLEFMLWASWYVPIGAYMNSVLRYPGWQISLIYATTAIAAMVSPMFVGYVADRLFATERVLAVLEIVGGLCLLVASQLAGFWGLWAVLLVNALCFMPTLALCNSIAFRNIDDPNRFSRIAVWGTIGWIVSGLVVDSLLGGAQAGKFFYLAGGGAIAMGLYSLTLPHTPPKGAEAGGDVLGLGALRLFRDSSFVVFAVCAFLISIPLSYYFTFGSAFLTETNRPKPTALMTLCQVSEIVVMIIMPWFIGRFGLKTVLMVGMSAWAVRYVLFATNWFPLVILGLLVHGFCYCFVFVASFIYVSRRAPTEMSASAQSLMAFLMWGVGMFVGTILSGQTADAYAPMTIGANQRIGDKTEFLENAPWPKWSDFRNPKQQRMVEFPRQAASAVPEGLITTLIAAPEPVMIIGSVEVLGQIGTEGLRVVTKRDENGAPVEEMIYEHEPINNALALAAGSDTVLTEEEWQAYTTHFWRSIWLWPGLLAAIVAGIFWRGADDATHPICVDAAPAKETPPAAPPAATESGPPAAGDSSPPQDQPPQ